MPRAATGDTSVAHQLRGAGFEVHEAGDCTGVGYIEGAIRNAQQVVDAINANIAPATAHDRETATA